MTTQDPINTLKQGKPMTDRLIREIVRKLEEKAETERRAADLAHREGIHREIRDALKAKGIPVNYAIDVVSLISTGSIPFVEVVY